MPPQLTYNRPGKAPGMVTERKEDPWVDYAYHCFRQSTTYIDNNYRTLWENNLRHWQNRHALGSKYNNPKYKYRSKIFRPKTRSTIRNLEAAGVAAFFSNPDVVSIEPVNGNDQVQQASADVMQEIVNYRLDKSIPWFQVCMGAIQDAGVIGVICSYQCWEYVAEEVIHKTHITGMDDLPALSPDGSEQMQEYRERVVKKDHPMVYLTPIENIRIHPAASWFDPVDGSPYLIRMIPMYVEEIKGRMKHEDPKTGKPKWKPLTDDQIRMGIESSFDSTRQTRDNERMDPMQEKQSLKKLFSMDIGWVHENFARINGQDYVWYTLATEYLLSKPIPIQQQYLTGKRPVVIGAGMIEVHKPLPNSVSGITTPIQEELNENANQRLDNVKLVMNKRYLVRKGRGVDVRSLLRNVPASVTMTQAPDDVQPMDFSDVTGSAFQEQDRLNMDFDELAGNFGPSTIQTNRQIGETVGGMAMMRGSSNALTEYYLRTIAETWMEKCLRQIVHLEQRYETNLTILSLAGQKAQIAQKYGIDEITDELLNQELTIRVNVGMGATDPIMKVSNFVMGLKAIAESHAMIQGTGLDFKEIASEIFGRLGHRDADRFWTDPNSDPEKQQMLQMIEQMQGALQQLSAQVEDKNADRQIDIMLAQLKERGDLIKTQMKEQGQMRRTVLQERGAMNRERLKLMNPVSGEKPPTGARYPRLVRPMTGMGAA